MAGIPSIVHDESVKARFWSKVDKSGDCWLWTAGRSGSGYGKIGVGGRANRHTISAHRLALELSGVHVPDHLCVLHSCDNPPCCNPAHLRLGTFAENNRDRDVKGRGKVPDNRGAKCGRAKLNDEAVLTMREMARRGISNAIISKKFGVVPATAQKAICGETWKELPGAVSIKGGSQS